MNWCHGVDCGAVDDSDDYMRVEGREYNLVWEEEKVESRDVSC